METPCPCGKCSERREHAMRMDAEKASWPQPEYDWDALEAAERRSREDPEWYKKPSVGAPAP